MLLRLHDRLRAEQDPDAGFAMIFTLLLIFIVAALSIAVAGIVYNQSRPTQYERKDVATVDAAYAGLQVALGQIRSAATTSGNTITGQLTSLRCTGSTDATFVTNGQTAVTTSGVTFAGSTNTTSGNNASAGNSAYATSVSYYKVDPTGHTLPWLQANAMTCPLASVPSYAYLQSHGVITGQRTVSGDRTAHATYQFKTTNNNIAGGRLIPLGATTSLCITDLSSPPKINDPLTMQPCQAVGYPPQEWTYRNDLTLYLAGYPSLNLCMQAATALAGAAVTLQTCTGSGSGTTYPYTSVTQELQEWGFNDSGHFATAGLTGGLNGTCLDPNNQTATSQAPTGTALVIVNCDGNTGGFNAWNPDAAVGAGKAGGNTTGIPGSPTNQYVNYAQFGRCLDITGQNLSADHLIAYPCKQSPDSTQLAFNQVWTYTPYGTTGYGTMSVYGYAGYYANFCLTMPASGNMVTMTSSGCTATPSASQLWKPTGNLTGNYANSFELTSQSSGQCLAADDSYNSQISDATPGSSTIVAEPCDGSLKQKWNAPPTSAYTALGNVGEDGGTANNTTP